MIEKQLRKPLNEKELFKTTMVEAYPLCYINDSRAKKIRFVPDYLNKHVERFISDDFGRTVSIDECIDEINEIWHVGGTVILMYDKKLKGYKTKVPFKYLTKSVKKMI